MNLIATATLRRFPDGRTNVMVMRADGKASRIASWTGDPAVDGPRIAQALAAFAPPAPVAPPRPSIQQPRSSMYAGSERAKPTPLAAATAGAQIDVAAGIRGRPGVEEGEKSVAIQRIEQEVAQVNQALASRPVPPRPAPARVGNTSEKPFRADMRITDAAKRAGIPLADFVVRSVELGVKSISGRVVNHPNNVITPSDVTRIAASFKA